VALDTIAKYKAALLQRWLYDDRQRHGKNTIGHANLDWLTCWTTSALHSGSWVPGGTPSAIPGGDQQFRTTVGAYPLPAPVSGKSRYLLMARTISTNLTDVAIILADRLVATSGIVMNVGTAQTVNTAALPRYTDGIGVCVGLETYTGLGSAGPTVSFSYTNTDGTAGQAGVLGTANTGGNQFRCGQLAPGDKGVLSVESVTVGSPGATAANYGITLYKPIAIMHAPQMDDTSGNRTIKLGEYGWEYLGLPKIEDDACLWAIGTDSNSVSGGNLYCDLAFGYA